MGISRNAAPPAAPKGGGKRKERRHKEVTHIVGGGNIMQGMTIEKWIRKRMRRNKRSGKHRMEEGRIEEE